MELKGYGNNMKLNKGKVLLKLERDMNIIGEKIEELKTLVPVRSDIEKENYRLALELCTWITVLYDFWREHDKKFSRKIYKNERERELFLGIKQAFNSFKHNFNIIGIGETEHEKFTLGERNYTINSFIWLPSKRLRDIKNNKAAFEAYRKTFEGKSVFLKLSAAHMVLSREWRLKKEK